MTSLRLIARSLRFHAREHLGVALGAAVGTAVLVGALIVGDSVRASLKDLALLRLGKVELALATGDRLFRSQLAPEIQQTLAQAGLGQVAAIQVAAALQLPAVATTADGSSRANRVTLLGVDYRFWLMSEFWRRIETERRCPLCGKEAEKRCEHCVQHASLTERPPPADTLILGSALADQLRVKAGAELVLRVQKPARLSGDAPMAPEEDTSVAWRLRVHSIVPDMLFGRFGLQASQTPPLNAFVALPQLQTKVGAPNRANLLLVGQLRHQALPGVNPLAQGVSQPRVPDLLTVASNALASRWTLDDAQLEWRIYPSIGAIELRTPRVFLDQAAAGAALRLTNLPPAIRPAPAPVVVGPVAPGGVFSGAPAVGGVLTYFVNELSVSGRATPYSMVAAVAPPGLPVDLEEDEVLVTQWLAEDTGAKPGDELSMRYFVLGPGRELEERLAQFRVRAVIPMDSPSLDRELMPDFPGLTEAQSCRQWDTGLDVDMSRIREKDEAYWRQYRGTPKALIGLSAGRKLWQNRFGELTAVRLYAWGKPLGLTPTQAQITSLSNRVSSVSPTAQAQALASLGSIRSTVAERLRRSLNPASFQLRWTPVRADALAAVGQGQDFGQLFLGFSVFLITAALMLMSLLFQFSLEQRGREIGTFLATGYTRGQVTRLLTVEGGLVALVGGLGGVWGATVYAQAMIKGLTTIWSGAIGDAGLRYRAEPLTLLAGTVAALFIACLTIWLGVRRRARLPARVLLAEGEAVTSMPASARRRGVPRVVASVALLGAASLVCVALVNKDTAAAGMFFGAGALLLIGGMALCTVWLRCLPEMPQHKLTLAALGVRGAARRERRSLAVAGALACGTFLVAAVGVFRLEVGVGTEKPASGTGGFDLIGESTQPVIHDLTSVKGRDAYSLNASSLSNVVVVPFRVRDGEDASCLNLNRAQTPRLLGVQPELLQRRGSFTFAQVAKGLDRREGWLLLNRRFEEGVLPAIADQASILWALGKRVGDTVPYTDERGRQFRLKLVGAVANSLLQGNLIVSERDFLSRFPGTTGHRWFLIDAPANAIESARVELTRGLKDLGLELVPTARRLGDFNRVQNTYLGTFQVLGGLGVILGSAGLGAIVLRNVLERRGELALMLAVGFRARSLRRLILAEHIALLSAGLVLGTVAALIAVLPSVLTPGTTMSHASAALTLGGIVVNGVLWIGIATAVALRGNLLETLRNR